jgi:hypothetical protein
MNRNIFAIVGLVLALTGCGAPVSPEQAYPYREEASPLYYSGYNSCLIHKNLAEFYPGQAVPREARNRLFFDATVVKTTLAADNRVEAVLRVEKMLAGGDLKHGQTVTVYTPVPSRGGISFEPLEKYRVAALKLRGHYYAWEPYIFDMRQGVPSDCYMRPGHFHRHLRF